MNRNFQLAIILLTSKAEKRVKQGNIWIQGIEENVMLVADPAHVHSVCGKVHFQKEY